MSAYCYIKRVPQVETNHFSSEKKNWWPFSILLLGLVLLFIVVWPFFNYHFFGKDHFSQKIISPTNKTYASSVDDLVVGLSQQEDWLPAEAGYPQRLSKITHYTLTIPKLRIDQAVVEIGGQDLKKSLVQHSGAAHPGQPGNVVIFGHSTLPHFYNPNNYQTIFSTLPNLEKGDKIIVNFDGVTYLYQVRQLFEVEPDDVSVLTQSVQRRYLSLITCVPPGSYFRRLVVRAELI